MGRMTTDLLLEHLHIIMYYFRSYLQYYCIVILNLKDLIVVLCFAVIIGRSLSSVHAINIFYYHDKCKKKLYDIKEFSYLARTSIEK